MNFKKITSGDEDIGNFFFLWFYGAHLREHTYFQVPMLSGNMKITTEFLSLYFML